MGILGDFGRAFLGTPQKPVKKQDFIKNNFNNFRNLK